MELLLVVSEQVDSAVIVRHVSGYGLQPTVVTIGVDWLSGVRAVGQIAVLVWPSAGVVNVGDRVKRLREKLPKTTALVVCAPRPTPEDRRILVECGASEVVTPSHWSPFAIAERLVGHLAAEGHTTALSCGELRFAANVMIPVSKDIDTYAHLSDPVLITGETGTGKEVVARELHRRSGRPGDLVAINCATLRPELSGSELFGHVRGAFTSADLPRTGLLMVAGEGSLLLDELPDLSLAVQAELLRVIEERKVRPLGDNTWRPIRARLILATNRDLDVEVTRDRFRHDLLERVRSFCISIPPLRSRQVDIPLLVNHFLEEYDDEYRSTHCLLSGSLDGLFRHDWPGNVRELRQVVRVAAARTVGSAGQIDAADFDAAIQRRPKVHSQHRVDFDPNGEAWRSVLDRTRRAYFQAVLQASGGDREAARQRTGLGRSQFYEVLKQLDLLSSDSQ